jgi:hypothetical protein
MDDFDVNRFTQLKVADELPIFGYNFEKNNPILELAQEAIKELQITHPETTPSNLTSLYMSPWKSHRLTDKFNPLINLMGQLILKTFKDYFTTDLESLNYTLAVSDCWGAIYEKSNYAAPHRHFPSDFATVIYLDVDDDAAPIVFANSLVVKPVSGTAIIFPGILLHHVPATEGRRIIVAINFIKIPNFDMGSINSL